MHRVGWRWAPLPWLDGIERAKRPMRLPVVLTRAETGRVIDGISGTAKLLAILMYGSGLRLMEAVSLRVKDVDLSTRAVTVRSGKGDKDRITVLPERLVEPLEAQRRKIERLWRVRPVVGATRDSPLLPSTLALDPKHEAGADEGERAH